MTDSKLETIRDVLTIRRLSLEVPLKKDHADRITYMVETYLEANLPPLPKERKE